MDLDARRKHLLEIGVRLFAASNYDDVAIEDIAEAAGVSRALLYHYFAGKREYYVATVAHAAGLVRALEPDSSLKPDEQLRLGLERFFDSMQQLPQAHAVLRAATHGDPEVAGIVERERRAFAARVLAGLPADAAGSPLLVLTARAWIDAVVAAAWAWAESAPRLGRDDVVIVMAQALAAALTAAARLDGKMEVSDEITQIVGRGVLDAAVSSPRPAAPPHARSRRARSAL